MISQNYALVSFTIYLFVKIVCKIVKSSVVSMHSKPTLTSIPERSENEEERWVSKKRHDVLKAKYKCLKKLFQIYDASVIGILPETYVPSTQECQTPEHKIGNKKESLKTEDLNQNDDNITDDDKTAATDVIKELKLDQVISVESNDSKKLAKCTDDKSTQDSKENLSVVDRDVQHAVPYLVINEKKKLTRFQSFIQRILGIRRDRYAYVMAHDREYASDNNISNRYEKRRRRGLRLRRTRRPKKTQSEMALRDVKSPVILSYVQSIQRHCLLDTTPRHCPIVGCKMLLYGIINYNDHLNLSHFPQRAHVCVYCHEGFASHADKAAHESEHIGITKLPAATTIARFSNKIASNTQTDPVAPKLDVPHEKLKKIVSFFDKIADTGQVVTEPIKTRYSDTKLRMIHRNPRTGAESSTGSEGSGSGSHPASLRMTSTVESDVSSSNACAAPARCQLCGDSFDFRHQLNLHLDTHHRKQEKFTKFNSCAGILNRSNRAGDHSNQAGDRSNQAGDRSNQTGNGTKQVGDRTNRAGYCSNQADSRSNQGESRLQTATQSLTRSFASTDVSDLTNLTKLSRRKSDETLSYDPSTNIIYFGSTESVKEPSSVQDSRSGLCYKWEPGTAIIRV